MTPDLTTPADRNRTAGSGSPKRVTCECPGWARLPGGDAGRPAGPGRRDGGGRTGGGPRRIVATFPQRRRAGELRVRGEYEPGPTDVSNEAQDEAAKAFTKALELSPEFPITRALLRRVLLMQGRPREAPAEIEREPDQV